MRRVIWFKGEMTSTNKTFRWVEYGPPRGMNDGPACEDYNGPLSARHGWRYAVIGEDGFMRVYEGHAVTHIKTGDAGRCDKCGGFV